MDGDRAGSVHLLHLPVEIGELRRRQGEVDGAAFAGGERHPLEAFQFEHRPRDRQLCAGDVELNHLVAGSPAGVGDGGFDLNRLIGANLRGRQSRLGNLEAGVAEPVPEREQRRRVIEQVAAAGAGLVVVEQRNLPGVSHHADRQLGARVDLAEQRLGDHGAAFLARVPALDNGVGFCHDVGPARRTAVDRADHQRLAERRQRIDQSVLLADDVEVVAVAEMVRGKPLTAGLLGVADGQDDGIGGLCHAHRLLDQLHVALARKQLDIVDRAVVAGGDEHPLRGDEIGVGSHGAQPVDQRHRLPGHARVAAEADDGVVRADHGHPAHPGRIERQRAVPVGKQAERLSRRLQRQRTSFGIAGNGFGLGRITVRIVEQPGAHLEGQHAGAGAVDQCLVYRTGLDLVWKGHEALPLGQLVIHAGDQRQPRRLGIVGRDMVQRDELVDAVVVARDDPVETPFPAQHLAEQPHVGVVRHTVDLVVARHHRSD